MDSMIKEEAHRDFLRAMIALARVNCKGTCEEGGQSRAFDAAGGSCQCWVVVVEAQRFEVMHREVIGAKRITAIKASPTLS
jgi:hypothetical protein